MVTLLYYLLLLIILYFLCNSYGSDLHGHVLAVAHQDNVVAVVHRKTKTNVKTAGNHIACVCLIASFSSRSRSRSRSRSHSHS